MSSVLVYYLLGNALGLSPVYRWWVAVVRQRRPVNPHSMPPHSHSMSHTLLVRGLVTDPNVSFCPPPPFHPLAVTAASTTTLAIPVPVHWGSHGQHNCNNNKPNVHS